MGGGWSDADRAVELDDECPAVRDDRDASDPVDRYEERLLDERPPHWVDS